jgi:hypothetical protein
MLLQLCSLGDGSDSEKWFERGGGSSSSVRSWLQLSDFFGHLKMFNLCITAALTGLRLVDDDTSLSFRLRLCLHVSESHSNLGNVSEAIRFINVAMQDIMTSIMRRKRKDKKLDGSEQDVESALSKAFDRFDSAKQLLLYFTCFRIRLSLNLHEQVQGKARTSPSVEIQPF